MEGENNFIPPLEKKLYKATIICVGCGKNMGEKDGFEQEGTISHSRCDECKAKALAEAREYAKNHPPEKK